MKYIKIRDVKSPERGTELAAGIDFFVPTFDENFKRDFLSKNDSKMSYVDNLHNRIVILPQGRTLIPSGIKTYFAKDRLLLGTNKSGVATKKGLDIGATLIDADYSGEVHISLTNPTKKAVIIEEGDKVAQFIEMQYLSTVEEIQENEYEQLHASRNTARGEGGFGSTGTK